VREGLDPGGTQLGELAPAVDQDLRALLAVSACGVPATAGGLVIGWCPAAGLALGHG
jgi:hypothetical protein